MFAAFERGHCNAVPGAAGPPEPPVKFVEAVKVAELLREQLGVEVALRVQTVALIVCSVSAAAAPPLAPTYIRHPARDVACPPRAEIGGAIVTVDVAPDVVTTDDAAVSTEQGVSVFARVKKVTQIRYDPAATAPPVEAVEAPVASEVETVCPTKTVGGAAMLNS